jgi:cytochrome c oxidase assembly protein subunit 11
MSDALPTRQEREQASRRTLAKLSVVAIAMFGFGYALVPFYQQICKALGINSLVERNDGPVSNTQVDPKRTVTIEFDANAHGMPWRFQPAVRHMQVHPGQLVQVDYEVANVRGAPVTGQAVASYGPMRAGQYFKKLECFCFTQQTLAGGETRRMPVVFVIDPGLPEDVNTITLSYTFFEVAGKS